MKQIIYEGKVVIAGHLVDFRIFKEFDEKGEFMGYSYATNPQLKDKDQADFHDGETLRAMDLETLLFRFMHSYLPEFKEIIAERENPNYFV